MLNLALEHASPKTRAKRVPITWPIVLAVLVASACAPGSSATPTPAKDPALEKYVTEARAFSSAHSETLSELTSAIERLASESVKKPELGRGIILPNPDTGGRMRFRVNQGGMSDQEFSDAMRQWWTLSPELKEMLRSEQETLVDLHLRVKRDQVMLLQIVPPVGTPTDFHQMAMFTLDQETATLLSLLNFYSSPELRQKDHQEDGKFSEFPAQYAGAQAQLARAREHWSIAGTVLSQLSVRDGVP